MKIVGLLTVGLIAGMMSGLFGVGGGIVTVPLLILIFGFPAHIAIGTSVITIVPTALMASVRHAQLSHVNFKVAGVIAAGAVLGALIGASLTPYLDAVWLKRGFGLLLIGTGLRMLLK
jgi:uncharacterized membrane protein YfcA